MNARDKLYQWWKRKPVKVRKPFTFALGFTFIAISPIVGSVPGPGGIALFLAGIAVLASEFDWAENLKAFFLTTVPKEIQNRWKPTPRWHITFDLSAVVLLASAACLANQRMWWPVISFTTAGVCLFLFNRERLARLKKRLKR